MTLVYGAVRLDADTRDLRNAASRMGRIYKESFDSGAVSSKDVVPGAQEAETRPPDRSRVGSQRRNNLGGDTRKRSCPHFLAPSLLAYDAK